MRALFILAAVGLVACSAEAESPFPTSTPAQQAPPTDLVASEPHSAAGSPSADDSAYQRAAGTELAFPHEQPSSPSGFVCRPGAFCEDFEANDFKAHWAGISVGGQGTIELGADSASLGHSALRVASRGPSSFAFLPQSKGTIGQSWSGMVGFSFRVDQVPAKYLGGPELTVQSADGPLTIRFAMTPEGVLLEQRATDQCISRRCEPVRSIIAAAHANHWYRVRLGFEVNGQDSGPYGRVEAAVDDGEAFSTDLSIPFFGGAVSFSAGITQGDTDQRAFADLDDVTLLMH